MSSKYFQVKNGINTPNVTFYSSTVNSKIDLTYLDSNVLSFSGTSGQLFSIADSQTGTIYAVNDISGIPSIEVDDDGTIRFAETFGNVLIGTATNDGVNKLQVTGNIAITGNIGVNVTNPVQPLDVAGAIKTTSGLLFGSTQSYMYENAANSIAWRVGSDGPFVTLADTGSNIINFTNVNGPLALGSTNTERIRLESTGVIYANQVVQEGYITLSGTAPVINANLAAAFDLTTSGNTTFTFSTVTTGRAIGFVLKLTGGGSYAITWPASVKWSSAAPPTAPGSGQTSILVFFTVNGGTTWFGFESGSAMG